MDFIPERSEIQVDNIKLNSVVKSMIKDLGVKKAIPQLKKKEWSPNYLF